MMEIYTVWVGGVEAVCYPVDLERAKAIAESLYAEGYDDVHICLAGVQSYEDYKEIWLDVVLWYS